MLDEAESLPDDVAALKAMVLTSQAELAARDAELRNRDLLIEKLKHQLAGLRRQRFGVGSEALDQLELGLEDEEIARAASSLPGPLPGAKRQPKRRPLPEHLPREETVLTPGERCTDCGGSLKRLGEDVTEELEYIPTFGGPGPARARTGRRRDRAGCLFAPGPTARSEEAAEAPPPAGASAARRDGSDAGRAMHRLRRQSQAARRGCHRGVGIHPGTLRGEAHRAPAPQPTVGQH